MSALYLMPINFFYSLAFDMKFIYLLLVTPNDRAFNNLCPHELQPATLLCPWVFQAGILEWAAMFPPGGFIF